MARLDSAEPILRAARKWRETCLIEDGSILSGESLWNSANLAELDRYFVQNLDMGEGDFFSKLESQLQPASGSAKRLAAEIFWVMYLMVSESAMSAETKRFQIRKVWEWSGVDLPEDNWALGVLLSQGISHPGTAYNTHRWRELRFFITLLEDWKRLSADERRRLLDDPWRFAEWIEARKYAKARQLRHILLYLLFPDHFERIATASHKRKIIKRFRTEWGEDPDDFDYKDRIALDREVLRVRERLEEEYGEAGDTIDFYREPVVDLWRDRHTADETEKGGTEKVTQEEDAAWFRNRFGEVGVWLIAPGEGARLWRDFHEKGLMAIGWDYLGDLTEYSSREEIHEEIAKREKVENPFNQSLAVWEFFQGIRPGDVVIAKQGRSRVLGWGRVEGEYTYEPERVEYQHVRPVEWKERGEWSIPEGRGVATKTLTDFKPYADWVRWAFETMEGDRAETDERASSDGRYDPKDALKELFLEPAHFSRILDSLARRKNVILQGPPGVGKTFMARRLAYAHIGRRDPSKVQLVQFHQSYAYEDFIQGWRPNEKGGFILRNGVFHAFCTRALQDPETPHVFIIDEINRGNLSRIFGELMMLIEGDKRGREHAIALTYSSGETFFVPDNVHLIGLMNTADRSLAMVDYALRRRFGFLDLTPAYGGERFTDHLLQVGVPPDLVQRINERMLALNAVIREDRKNLGPGFEIGHSYFVPSGEEGSLDEGWYESVVQSEIVPLLREYWFDQPKKVDEHAGLLLA